ncbi:MAG: HlyD family efflux transporter periplasmic adaptor subunit [Planctomycetota bacterium]
MPRPRRLPTTARALSAGVALSLMAGLLVGCDTLAPPPPPAESAPVGPPRVFALGSLQPAGGVVSISAAPGDRLKALHPSVAVNQPAPANGVLGLMVSYDTLRARFEALQTKRELAAEKHELDKAASDAQLRAAEASLAQASAKLTEIAIQEKRLSYLEEAAAIAEADLARLEGLAEKDAELVTRRQLRRQANRVDQARKDFEIANETFVAGVAAASAAKEAALANKQAAERSRSKLDDINPIRAVDEEIRLARQALAQGVLLTPDRDHAEIDATRVSLTGGDSEPGRYTVLKVFLRRGEAVTQTPVLQVADLSAIECVAEVYEADAKSIRPGQRATITSDAFNDAFADGITGEVTSISRMVASTALSARNPLAPRDRSVVEVRVAIDPADADATAESARWIGLQVRVAFDVERPTE